MQFLLGFHNMNGSCSVRSSLALFCAFLNFPLQVETRGSILTAPCRCLYFSTDWGQNTKVCVSAEQGPRTSWFVVSRSWRAAGSWALAGIFQATLNACKKAADQANNWHFWVLAVGIVQLSAVVQNSPKQNIRPVRSKQVCRNLPPLHGSWSSAPESHLNPLEDCLFFFPSLFLTLLCLFCF